MAAKSSMSLRNTNNVVSTLSTAVPLPISNRIRARSEVGRVIAASLTATAANDTVNRSSASTPSSSAAAGQQRRIAEVWQAEVNRQLESLANIELGVQRAIANISTATTSLKINQQLAAIVKQIKQLTDRIKTMNDEAAGQDSAADTDFITERLAKHTAIADELQSSARRAALSAHRSLEQLSDAERKELIGDSAPAEREKMGDDAVHRSRQLTEALKRTHQALQQQLDRSAAALNALEGSSHTLEEANDEYTGMGSEVTRGTNLITRLQIRERTDRWMIVIGILFFMLTCLVIIRGRIGPRLPSFTFIFGSPAVSTATTADSLMGRL